MLSAIFNFGTAVVHKGARWVDYKVIPVFLVFVIMLLTFGAQQTKSTVAAAPNWPMIATPEPVTNWNITTKTSKETSQTPAYAITISQPVLVSADGNTAPGVVFNAAVEKFKSGALDDFKKSAAEAAPGAPSGSYLDISYDIFVTHHGLVSVRFNIDSYSAGAAHPAHASYSLNYDPVIGKTLSLADLFKPGSKYLDLIAKYASDDLSRQGRLIFPEGATAKPENYVNWNLDRGGLLITFDPYQVGPYVQGGSEVYIPYTTLGDALKIDIYDLS